MTDFEQHDLLGLINGIKTVGTIITQADSDLQDCEGMKDDIQSIEDFAQIFKNGPLLFETVYMNTLRYHKAIGDDILEMLGDATRGDYAALGSDVADVLVIALKPLDTVENQNLNLY